MKITGGYEFLNASKRMDEVSEIMKNKGYEYRNAFTRMDGVHELMKTRGDEFLNASKSMDEVYEIMKSSDEISAALDHNAESMFSPFSEISAEMKAAKKAAIADTAQLRSPKILNTRIAMALSRNRCTEKTWENATATGRIEMMDKAFEIMMEEMQIPDKIRKDLQLLHSGTESKGGNMVVAGHCNRFVSPDESGQFTITEKPVVEMHYALMYQNFDTALGSLYNQAVKVMQQATCIEPKGTYLDSVEQSKWAAEITEQANGKFPETSNMQQFAVNAERDMLNRYHHIINNQSITTKAISLK